MQHESTHVDWAGRVYLFLRLSLGGTSRLNAAVPSAGDVDTDGKDDLLVGGLGSNFTGTDAGRAYLVVGGGALDL